MKDFSKYKVISFLLIFMLNGVDIHAQKKFIEQQLVIPVFVLNEKARSYICGDIITPLIDTTYDSTFSYVVYFKGTNVENRILNKRPLDSLYTEIAGTFYNAPFMNKMLYNNRHDRRLLKYLMQYPDRKVFILNNFPGFWAMDKAGKIFKINLGYISTIQVDGRKYLSRKFGQEYVRDAQDLGGVRIGVSYQGCP